MTDRVSNTRPRVVIEMPIGWYRAGFLMVVLCGVGIGWCLRAGWGG